MKYWAHLHPSAEVGEEISVEEAGLCYVCQKPWIEGSTWCPVAQYEDDNKISLLSVAVHSYCRGALKREP